MALSTCIAGVLRCYAVKLMTENIDVPWNFGRGFIWSSIEPSLGIIAACLPTLRPLVRYLFPKIAFTSNNKRSQYKNSEPGLSSKPREFYRLQDGGSFPPNGDEIALTNDIRKGPGYSNTELDPEHDPGYSITVQREILLTSKTTGN